MGLCKSEMTGPPSQEMDSPDNVFRTYVPHPCRYAEPAASAASLGHLLLACPQQAANHPILGRLGLFSLGTKVVSGPRTLPKSVLKPFWLFGACLAPSLAPDHGRLALRRALLEVYYISVLEPSPDLFLIGEYAAERLRFPARQKATPGHLRESCINALRICVVTLNLCAVLRESV
jgi:hypothetical protein